MTPFGKIKAVVVKINPETVVIRLIDDSKVEVPKKFFKVLTLVENQEVFYQLVEHKDGTFHQEIIEIESNKLTAEQIKEIHDSQ